MESWPNLHTVVFAPQQFHDSVFDDVLPMLLQLPLLRHLTINNSCCGERHVPVLSQLRDLVSLTIYSPPRAVLHILPELLEKLKPGLKRFHLLVCKDARNP